jgi:hypothetical protein
MKTSDLLKIDGFELLQPKYEDGEISSGYTSDLLSDVMAHAQEDCAFITIQSHKNTVAVASLIGARVIIICNNRPVLDDMIEAAAAENVAIIRTTDSQFVASCKVNELL